MRFVVLAFACLACTKSASSNLPPSQGSQTASSPISASASTLASASASAPPLVLRSPTPTVALEVKGFGDAVVSLPIGATSKKPIMIAAHGNYDRPEWQCEVWRSIVHDRAFVLCPRGVRRTDSPSPDDIRFTYDGGDAMTREIDAGLAALRARYADFVYDEAEDAVVYTGFSLGAISGVAFVLRSPAKYPRLVLTEGSHPQWSPAAVHKFATAGGKRVLFACGQPSCVTMSKSVATVMEKKGLAVKVVHGKGVGHGYDGPVADEIRAVFDWLVEGDPRFASP